jgi:hypothetical protein
VSQVVAARKRSTRKNRSVGRETCCTLRFCLRFARATRDTSSLQLPRQYHTAKGGALALKDRHGHEASHGGWVTPGYSTCKLNLGRKRNDINIPHKTQFWNSSRDAEEIHFFGGEVWVVAAHAGGLALPFATLVLAALGDLAAFLLVLASDVEFAFDVCLRK